MAFTTLFESSITRGPIVLPQGASLSWDELAVYGPGPVVKIGPNDYRMWYEGITNDGLTDHLTQTGYATSADGNNWTKYASNPVIVPSAVTWENSEASLCSVVYNASGSPATFEGWFHGGNNTGGSGGGRAIGYATSSDGITWTKYASNPVLQKGTSGTWDDKWDADAKVIKVSATDYRMWYGGTRASDGKRQIGYATSSDGIAWTKSGSNPILTWGAGGTWDATDIQAFCPIMVSSTEFHAWYIGLDAGGNTQTGYASSTDGIAWTKSTLNPTLANVTVDAPTGSIHVYWDGGVIRIMRGCFDSTSTPIGRTKRLDTITPRYPRSPSYKIADAFNRTAENPLANGRWTTGGFTAPASGLKSDGSKAIRQLTTGNFGRDGSYLSQYTISNDCEAGYTVGNSGSDGEIDLFIINVAARQGYHLDATVGTFGTVHQMNRTNAGTDTTIGSSFARALTTGDKVCLQIDGNYIVMWTDTGSGWVERVRVVDTTYRLTFNAGAEIAGLNDVTSAAVDDFGTQLLLPPMPVLPVDLPFVYLRKNL